MDIQYFQNPASQIGDDFSPEISVIMPTQGKHAELMRSAVHSVIFQHFKNFELLIVNDGGEDIREFVESFNDRRIRYFTYSEHRGDAFARNIALKKARGKYIAYLGDGDQFYPEHLETLYNFLINNDFAIAYTDSIRDEQINRDGKYIVRERKVAYSDDFDYNKILVENFIPILNIMHEKSCYDLLGGFDETMSTLSDWEMWLKFSLKYKFAHLAQTTAEYTWLNDNSSITSANLRNLIETKKYVYEKYAAETAANPEILRAHRIDIMSLEQELATAPDAPRFSFIIPVKNALNYTKRCIESIRKFAGDTPYEIIVIDNNSTDGTANYLRDEAGVTVITNRDPQNYSESNNRGAKAASSEYLIFLNNDTELKADIFDAIRAGFDADAKVAVQGAKLLYANGFVQHCGIAYGFLGSYASHYHLYPNTPPNAARVNKLREFQFVTGAFMAIKRGIFEQVGGFDEKYQFGYEDLDLCMKIRKAGGKVIYNPAIELYHFESVTKALIGKDKFESMMDTTGSKSNPNRDYFLSKWKEDLTIDDDIFYYEDGMHGLLANTPEQDAYIARVTPLLNKINDLLTAGKTADAERLINLLFDCDLKSDEINRAKQFNIPIDNLAKAENFLLPPAPAMPKSNKTRLLYVMYGWNETGGGTTLPKALAKNFAEDGFEISIFYASLKSNPAMPPYSLEKHEEDGITLYGLYNRPAIFTDANNPDREVLDPNIDARFSEVLDEVQPDVIHFHNFHGMTMSIAHIARERGIPSCFTPHNYYVIDPNLYMFDQNLELWDGVDMLENSFSVKENPDKLDAYRRRQTAARLLLNEEIDMTLCVSKRQRELFEKFGIDRKKMPVVNQANPIVELLQSDQSLAEAAKREITLPIRFGFIGGVMPQKGVHLLALAAKQFAPEVAEFHIYGFSGDAYRNVLDRIDTDKRLIYHGEYKYEDLAEIGKNIDVAVVPSVWEDCAPLVILELIAMHLPVIGTAIGGITDFIIPDRTGWLFNYNDEVGLINRLQFCIDNPAIIRHMRENMPTAYSFTQYSEQLKKIYKSLKDKEMKDPLSFELNFSEFTGKAEDEYIPENPAPAVAEVQEPENVLPEVSEPEIIANDTPPAESADSESDEEFLRTYFLDKDFKVQNFEIHDYDDDAFFDLDLSVRVYKDAEQTPENSDVERVAEPGRELVYKLDNEIAPANAPAEPEPQAQTSHQLNIAWEGTQFVYHSLALVNREICSNIIASDVAELTIIPFEDDRFAPEGNPKYQILAEHDIRNKDLDAVPAAVQALPHVRIRHQWPPVDDVPLGSKWIIMQPWEMSAHRKDLIATFAKADEIWTPSNFSRQTFINSGINPDKVQVIPNGVNTEIFTPLGEKLPIPTLKRFKFLYVGGTIYRKGIDLLLQAYVSLFTSEDDVCLIIKDMGGDSFYRGQTAKEKIFEIKAKPGTPEIQYIDAMLTEEETASLYRTADVFVSPYRGEGFSLPTLEAMACGLPVIVTEGGATDDFVDDSVGYLIPSNPAPLGNLVNSDDYTEEPCYLEPDLHDLIKIMKFVVADPSRLFRKGVAGMLRARTHWTWQRATEKVFARLDALYGTNMATAAAPALEKSDDELITFARACEFFDKQDFTSAMKLWNDVILSSQLPQRYTLHIYHNLALHFMTLGELDKADVILKNAIKDVVENPDNSYLRAVWYAKQGKYPEAYDTLSYIYENWVHQKTDSTLGIALDKLLNLNGEISLMEGEPETALRLFTEGLKFNNDSAEACYGAGLCFEKMGNPAQAKEMFEWTLKLNPNFEEAQEELNLLAEIK